MKAWQCVVCNYIHKGNAPPEKCPVCSVPATKFKEIDEVSITDKIAKPIQSGKKCHIRIIAPKLAAII